MYQNDLIKKIGLISNLMTLTKNCNRSYCPISQAWLTKYCNSSYCPISREQTLKFGQLIECNKINIFLKKSYIKYGGETCPRLFSEISKSSISLDQ